MAGYVTNIKAKAERNIYFRAVLFTGPHSQLVVMALQPGEDIGLETHVDVDQLIRVEAGQGVALLEGEAYPLAAGSAVVIPAGTAHNIINCSQAALKLSTIYTPPEHPAGLLHKTKAEALDYVVHIHDAVFYEEAW
jgi:mannose-6-phosphate isomerase-like protein (cupin superfamily)